MSQREGAEGNLLMKDGCSFHSGWRIGLGSGTEASHIRLRDFLLPSPPLLWCLAGTFISFLQRNCRRKQESKYHRYIHKIGGGGYTLLGSRCAISIRARHCYRFIEMYTRCLTSLCEQKSEASVCVSVCGYLAYQDRFRLLSLIRGIKVIPLVQYLTKIER